MKILNKNESREKLVNLMSLFQSDDFEKLEKYLNSKPFRFTPFKFFSFGFDAHRLPFLFWDYREAKKIYESVISIGATFKEVGGQVYGIAKYDYLDKIADFLEKRKIDKIYGAGSWSELSEVGHNVVMINPKELKKIIKKNSSDDIYFFDKDFNWMLAFNHHGNGFLAGDQSFINDFTNSVPDFRKYQKFDDDCPNCSL